LTVINELSRANYEAAHGYFDDELQSTWQVNKLKELWLNLNEQLGPFREVSYFKVESIEGAGQKVARVELTCLFADGIHTITMDVTSEGNIKNFLHHNPSQN